MIVLASSNNISAIHSDLPGSIKATVLRVVVVVVVVVVEREQVLPLYSSTRHHTAHISSGDFNNEAKDCFFEVIHVPCRTYTTIIVLA